MRKILFVTFGFIVASIFGLIQPALTADALSGWKAGRIINDSVFTDHTSMSASQIQSFLNGKVTSCDTNGQKLSEFGGPDLNGDGKVQRWEWGKSKYNQTKFVCIKDYVVDGKKASQIIYEKAQKYKISPRVLIVLLQKEQGLITDTWPLNIQYRSATGYGCPDTAPCDSQYYGLANQVDWAARMFRAIMNDAPDWYTPYNVGNNYIQYNPQASCGGSNVYIENRSTQALYNYTPYQPNKGALDAGWGSATCGAYGNRNFYLYFSSWFGRPNGNPYSSLDEVRWMQLSSETTKYDLLSGEQVDDMIPINTQLFFKDKITIGNEVYLRTKYDSENNLQKGIRLSDLIEVPYQTRTAPKWLLVSKLTNKSLPHSGKLVPSSSVPANTKLEIKSYITINGVTYYRTTYDHDHSSRYGINESIFKDIEYVPFKEPRYMQTGTLIKKTDPTTGTLGSSDINQGTVLKFDSKIEIDGQWFYRTSYDTTNDLQLAIPSTAITELKYENIAPKLMKTTTSLNKVDPATGQEINEGLAANTYRWFTSRVLVNGVTYYRTQYDTRHSLPEAIPESDLIESTPASYTPITAITMKTVASGIHKLDSYILTKVEPIQGGKLVTVNNSVTIDGKTYYRTSYDTQRNLNKIIPAASLINP